MLKFQLSTYAAFALMTGLGVVACSSSDNSGNGSGVTDSGADTSTANNDDAGNGSGSDSGPGTGTDSGNGGGEDSGPGTGTDAGPGTDSGPGNDAGTDSGPGTAIDAGPVSFTDVYTTIIGTTCTAHHSGGASASGALDMSTQALAFTDLVGVKAAGPACGGSGETRVVAGSHATSLLYMKVAGTQTCGSQMPLGETPLSAANVALIAAWIDQGAKND